jgi:negative regulator of flagellin synthesis FlgM
MAAAAAPDSDVRMDKVAEIQQALASGSYNVPASAVAGKMIDQMLGK